MNKRRRDGVWLAAHNARAVIMHIALAPSLLCPAVLSEGRGPKRERVRLTLHQYLHPDTPLGSAGTGCFKRRVILCPHRSIIEAGVDEGGTTANNNGWKRLQIEGNGIKTKETTSLCLMPFHGFRSSLYSEPVLRYLRPPATPPSPHRPRTSQH